MPGTQTYSGLTAQQKTFYDRLLLERLLPKLIWNNWAQKKGAPKREGDTINFRRFNSLAAATTALTEGVTPAGNDLSISALTATVSQYGDFITVSDKLDMVGIDPVITEATQVLSEQAANTIDILVRDILCAGTTIQYANGRASRATVAGGDNLTAAEVKKAVRTLRRNNVEPVTAGKYIGIIGPDAEYDLMSDPLWIDVSKYSKAEQIFQGEVGSLMGVKFIRTGNPKKFVAAGAAGIDVHATLVFGKGFYGLVDIAGSSKPEVIVKEHGSSGTADPLNQRSTIGWKCMFTAKILQDLAAVRIEHAATA